MLTSSLLPYLGANDSELMGPLTMTDVDGCRRPIVTLLHTVLRFRATRSQDQDPR